MVEALLILLVYFMLAAAVIAVLREEYPRSKYNKYPFIVAVFYPVLIVIHITKSAYRQVREFIISGDYKL